MRNRASIPSQATSSTFPLVLVASTIGLVACSRGDGRAGLPARTSSGVGHTTPEVTKVVRRLVGTVTRPTVAWFLHAGDCFVCQSTPSELRAVDAVLGDSVNVVGVILGRSNSNVKDWLHRNRLSIRLETVDEGQVAMAGAPFPTPSLYVVTGDTVMPERVRGAGRRSLVYVLRQILERRRVESRTQGERVGSPKDSLRS